MAKAKTKDRIKQAALELFNAEGEDRINAADIAYYIEISPGNLHYHFSSKHQITLALFDDFEREMKQILSAPLNEELKLEDYCVYLYIIFEEIWDFRFFYRNIAQILNNIPQLATRFVNLLNLLEKAIHSLLAQFEQSGNFAFRRDEKTALAERLSMHFTYWIPYTQLRYRESDAKTLINLGVYAALLQILPYWSKDREGFATLLADFLVTTGSSK